VLLQGTLDGHLNAAVDFMSQFRPKFTDKHNMVKFKFVITYNIILF
jgi:hypothetical protein